MGYQSIRAKRYFKSNKISVSEPFQFLDENLLILALFKHQFVSDKYKII